MSIIIGISTALTVVFVVAVLIGALVGWRKGAYRSAVKLGANVLSAVISLVIVLCLRSAVADMLMGNPQYHGLLGSAIGEEATAMVSQTIAAFALIFVFTAVFFIVRLIMLIPQCIINSRLPKKFKDAVKHGSDEDVVAVGYDESAEHKNDVLWQVLWHGGAVLCGALSAIIVLGAYVFPFAGFLTRGGTALSDIVSSLDKDALIEYIDKDNENSVTSESTIDVVFGIPEAVDKLTSSPFIAVTNFVYGKTVFEPILTINTDYGKLNVLDEMDVFADIASDAIPVIIHITENNAIEDGDVDKIASAAERLAESDFVLAIGSAYINGAADSIGESDGDQGSDAEFSEAKHEFEKKLSDVMTDMDPESLADDVRSVAQLISAVADSDIIGAVFSEEEEKDISDFADREALGEAFGILYDNDHAKTLLVPLINMGSETVFGAMDSEPIYSDADMNEISREELVGDADKLCTAIEGISAFIDSMEGENADLTTMDLASLGKSLDSLRASVLFGSRYGDIVDTFTSLANTAPEGGTDEDPGDSPSFGGDILNSVGTLVTDSASAEQALVSAQSIATIGKQLSEGTEKGSENKELVTALDTILTDTSAVNTEALTDLTSEILNTAGNMDENNKLLVEDCVNAITTISGSEINDINAEADAIQTLYDASQSENGLFEEVGSEKETVDLLLSSDLATEILGTVNAEGRDYGINEKLTEENKTAIKAALEESAASDDRKQTLSEFFGIK